MNNVKSVEFANREDWLEWRKGGIGSSDASILAATGGLCVAPDWVDRLGDQILFWDKLGMTRPKKANSAMQRGNNLEEPIRQRAEARLGFIAPANLERTDAPWLRASFDGITDDGEPVEIKAPSAKVAQLAKEGIIYGAYEAQLAHQMMVLHGHPDQWSGKERFHYVVLDPRDDEVYIITDVSERLRSLARRLFVIEERFWGANVLARECPVGGRTWFQMAQYISTLKTKMVSAEYYRQVVISAVRNKGYVPFLYHARRVAAGEKRTVDWKAIYDEAGVDSAFVDAQAGAPTWMASGGASKPLEEIEYGCTDPEFAETQIALFDETEKDLDLAIEQAKAYSKSLESDLAGPFGLRVFKRRGNIKHAELAKSLGISEAAIEAHTSVAPRPAYFSLVKKGVKSSLANKEGAAA